jgi:hypothetical protein
LESRFAVTQQLAGDDAFYPGQPALLHTLGKIGKERARALQPSAGHRHRLPPGVVEREMERDQRRRPHIPLLDQTCVRAFAGGDALVEVAHPERSFAEPFDIARREPTGSVGLLKQRKRSRPVVLANRSATTFY